jgi:thiamine-monophosphate kinase
MRLSELGEFSLIRSFRSKCADTSPEILKGIGDDAAAISRIVGTVNTTLVTSDMMLEGIHFNLSFTTFYQLGCKILAVNISDIFAMGGTPRYFLLSLGIPGAYDSKRINELYSGVMKIAKKFGITVVGGDTCASGQGLVLSGTLIGNADKIITRSGARHGDGIFVTNTLGDSAMGLMLLKKLGRRIQIKMKNENLDGKLHSNFQSKLQSNLKIPGTKLAFKEIHPLLKKHLMPEPQPLENTSEITSMIDISDGLLIDLSHICDESKVGAVIYKDKIPISREFVNAAKNLGVDPIKFTLKAGEDYVLLFTAPSSIKTNAVRIGEIIKKGRFLVDAKGRKTPFKAEGYEHFK